MAKIDYNAVLEGGYEVRVGNEYELAEGKWGTLRVPTQALQKSAFATYKEDGNEEAKGLKMARLVLANLDEFKDEDHIPAMAVAVVQDFFTLLTRIAEKLTPASEA
jgi:hypothetical protein